MYKILSTIILTTLLILTGAITGLAAWQLSLEVSTPDPNSDTGIATNRLTTGTDPTATDGYDNKLDTVALLGGPVQAYFPHTEYQSEQQKLWRDFRAESLPKEWEIEIQSSANSTVNLNWKIETPANLNFTLIDTDSNQETPMVSSSAYSYSNPAGMPKKFLLRVAENTTTNTSAGSYSSSGSSSNLSSGGGARGGGGGCGYIRNERKGSGSSGEGTSAALNMVILFTPLIWLSIKRIVFSESIVYVRKDGKEIFQRVHEEKDNPWSYMPASFDADNINTERLWGWRRSKYNRRR